MNTINNFPQSANKEPQELSPTKKEPKDLQSENEELRQLPPVKEKLPQADSQKHLDKDRSLKVSDSSKSKSLTEDAAQKTETAGSTPSPQPKNGMKTTEKDIGDIQNPAPVITLIHIGQKWKIEDLQRGYTPHPLQASKPLRFWIDLGDAPNRYNQLAEKMKTCHEKCKDGSIVFYVPEDDLDLAPKIYQSIWGCKQENAEKKVINDSPWDIDTLLNYELQER